MQQWYAKQIRGVQEKNLREFHEQGLNMSQIAREVGVDEKVIYNRFKLYGIKRKKGVDNSGVDTRS